MNQTFLNFFFFFLFLCLNHRAHAFHLPLWLRSSSSSAIFFIEDMLTCHRESIGVNVIINDGWIPFSWVSFELHVGYLSQCHGLPWHLNRSKPAPDWWLFFFFFFTKTSHNDCFEKGLLLFCDCHNINDSFGLNLPKQLWLFQTLSFIRMIYYSCSPFDRWFSLSSTSNVKMTADTFDLVSQGIYFLYCSDSHLTLDISRG